MRFIRTISLSEAKDFVSKNHYAVISPPINKLCIGLFNGDSLEGVAMWGYGVRPVHTIKRLFPSLEPKDYLELNRFCLLDKLPKNAESQFLKRCIDLIRAKSPEIKVLFTWADGIRGKCGFIYQASNFLYGGKTWSEFYVTGKGEVVHPRLLISRFGRRDKDFAFSLGLKKVKGYQFRYCRFLCSHGERKRLLRESPFSWTHNYPKPDSLKWKIIAEEGSRESFRPPRLKGPGRFRHSAYPDKLSGGGMK